MVRKADVRVEERTLVNPEQERQEEPGSDVPAGSPALAKGRDVEVVGQRVLTSLIDCSLVTLLSSVAFAPLLFVQSGLILVLVLLLLFVLLFCVFYVTYVAIFEGFRGQTPGKMLLGIAVIREEDGDSPGPGRAALRALIFLFADMIVGVFVMLASPKRQRPGDMAANTLVVRKRRS
jgi:uncharacterized RDD family membrane protein YckC